MKTLLSAFAAVTLISSCTYTTYVVPPPKPAPVKRSSSSSTKSASVSSSTAPDTFQAVTKPSSYSN
ncbi:hypothetical protein [Prosthecobacter sp.]|uniref:hypothetical protein n=1 Tax=Prosthecobacter sp. TaxID=1965333 RepID=UPI001D22C6DC|nr:hypothetical protein [Prosthecobacter sp.]MCB1276523.1 hypothetical protein [Prosthecobacter sp.]